MYRPAASSVPPRYNQPERTIQASKAKTSQRTTHTNTSHTNAHANSNANTNANIDLFSCPHNP